MKTGEQKSLFSFGEEKVESVESEKLKVEEKKEKKGSSKGKNKIETDYYEKSKIEVCAQRLKERFNVHIDVFPVKYGNKPPLNEKIYGYYMIVTIKTGDRDKIITFISEEYGIKTY